MDFERAAIQTLFYDYPIETAVKVLHSEKDEDFLRIFSDVSRWRHTSFTVSEWKMLESLLHDQWLGVKLSSGYAAISRCLNVLSVVAGKLLTLDANRNPLVRFDQLLRWRGISSLVTEDALITAYLAKEDFENSYPENRRMFLWPDVLHHDNAQLNAVLDKGLSDVHAHYHATADIFHLNWISMMNCAGNNLFDGYFKHYQDLKFQELGNEQVYQPRQLAIAAAYIRVILYGVLEGEQPKTDWTNLLDLILEGRVFSQEIVGTIKGLINNYKQTALKLGNGITFDYAIPGSLLPEQWNENYAILYCGERELMYRFFLKWNKAEESIQTIAPYMYLYLLIKAHLRRFFVQLHELQGFENFAEIQSIKNKAYTFNTWRVAPLLIAESVLQGNEVDKLEARINPSKFQEMCCKHYGRSLFSDTLAIENMQDRMSFVVHFLKENDTHLASANVERHSSYRKKLRRDLNNVLKVFDAQDNQDSGDGERIRIVGIDAAGSELKCRPEVYAHAFRYAKKRGMIGRTYHAGEDFYDLLDGLRAIDEAILFLQLDSDSRIGHALALSTDANKYYTDRHFNVVITQQALLDNYVWLYFKIKEYDVPMASSLELFLRNSAVTLYNQIGYTESFEIFTYWHSMLLRGDSDEEIEDNERWRKTAHYDNPKVNAARCDEGAKRIHDEYLRNQRVKQNGAKACMDRFPATIIPVVNALQNTMRREIAEKGIAIECCPTSNLKIGHFCRYDEHPIFTFRPIVASPTDPIINVSINTDDRGIFATSLYNEFSLIALAMKKMKDENGHQKYNDEVILDYIGRIRQNGFSQRFK